MERLRNYILTIWVQIRDLYLYVFRHAIVLNGYVDDHTWRGIRHRNWGDDLNYYLLRELTGRPVISYHNFKLAKWLHLKNYMCIGTMMDADNTVNEQTIIWGSGVSGLERSFVHPQEVLSVRGSKTKEFCDRYQVKCPEVYGDPALLLPLVYQPNVSGKDTKKYRLGIIPHVVDQQHPVIPEIQEKYSDEILIIDLAHYERWTDVIDQICSCEKILSSSLHGIIVSDAYQVPNCWITLSGEAIIGHFKFLDYFSSVQRDVEDWIKITKCEELFSIPCSCADRNSIKCCQHQLLEFSPFKVKDFTIKEKVSY